MDQQDDAAEDLLDRVATDYLDEPGVQRGTMFQSQGLKVNGKFFAFVGHDRRLIVKLPRARADEALGTGAAQPVTLGKRTLREWVAFPVDDDHQDATLAIWRGAAREAFGYVSGLTSR